MLQRRDTSLNVEVIFVVFAIGLFHGLALDSGKSEDAYLSKYGDYIGCFSNGCLQSELDTEPQSGFMNSPDNCTLFCQQDSYFYAGLHDIGDCMCSRQKPCFEKASDDAYCGLPCKHDSGKFCGGITHMSIYKVYVNGTSVSTFTTRNSPISIHHEHDTSDPISNPDDGNSGISPLYLGCIVGLSVLFVLVVLALIVKSCNGGRIYYPRKESTKRRSRSNGSQAAQHAPDKDYTSLQIDPSTVTVHPPAQATRSMETELWTPPNIARAGSTSKHDSRLPITVNTNTSQNFDLLNDMYNDLDSNSESDSDKESLPGKNYYHVLSKEGDIESSVSELPIGDQQSDSNDCLYALPDLSAKKNRSIRK